MLLCRPDSFSKFGLNMYVCIYVCAYNSSIYVCSHTSTICVCSSADPDSFGNFESLNTALIQP